jgi:elongator complex protein 3
MIIKEHNGNEVKKPVRTISGVTPLAVVLKPRPCNHGTCIYCPGGDDVPQSYTDKSPAIMRAMALSYDPKEQVKNRLRALKAMNHPTDKIELILLGGTFLQYPLDYQEEFIKSCYDALNEKDSKDLAEAQKINEKSEHRCVAMCLETRPESCTKEAIKRMREFGCTRVEIGVQNPDDEIYKKVNRGHTIKDVIESTQRLKDAGFKLGYHIMPGLPGSDYEKDMKNFKMIFNSSNFRPDQLKIYPCQIIEKSPLATAYEQMNFIPYDAETTKKIVKDIMKIIPEYCRVMRVMREIPKDKLVKGLIKLDVRRNAEEELRDKNVKINEIRMREIGFNQKGLDTDLSLRVIEYDASNGKEFFLQIVNKDNILFGLLRLRFPKPTFIDELKDTAIIREVHVYGKALKLGEEGNLSQHKGLGKMLMSKAEEIAKEAGYKKIAVISGIGVREYYKKLGYVLEGTYMVKKF